MHPLPRVDEIDTAVDGDPRGLLSSGAQWALRADGCVCYWLRDDSDSIDD